MYGQRIFISITFKEEPFAVGIRVYGRGLCCSIHNHIENAIRCFKIGWILLKLNTIF